MATRYVSQYGSLAAAVAACDPYDILIIDINTVETVTTDITKVLSIMGDDTKNLKEVRYQSGILPCIRLSDNLDGIRQPEGLKSEIVYFKILPLTPGEGAYGDKNIWLYTSNTGIRNFWFHTLDRWLLLYPEMMAMCQVLLLVLAISDSILIDTITCSG